jgi:hypothetical protein
MSLRDDQIPRIKKEADIYARAAAEKKAGSFRLFQRFHRHSLQLLDQLAADFFFPGALTCFRYRLRIRFFVSL